MTPVSASVTIAYQTDRGCLLEGTIESAFDHPALKQLVGRINLIFTSPPFPLVRKKAYGNETGERYLAWLRELAPRLRRLLAPDGSLVVEIGNAWVKGAPVMSTLPLQALLAVKEAGKLHLCQHVVCHNPARLPGPAEWVNVQRVRLKDSFTHVWWMSPGENPKANNRKVLVPYGAKMLRLLRTQNYNAGLRPSGHVISKTGFLHDHGGAIASNVVDLAPEGDRGPESLLRFSGASWDVTYRDYCRQHGYNTHPARMQLGLAAFFVEMLTEPGDIVFDPFAGSNTTGAVAESMGRNWIGVEADRDYALGSRGRFLDSIGRPTLHAQPRVNVKERQREH